MQRNPLSADAGAPFGTEIGLEFKGTARTDGDLKSYFETG
jgi:hypothetical protein